MNTQNTFLKEKKSEMFAVEIQNTCENEWYTIERWHDISNNVVCATSKGTDQSARTHRLIRAFASCLNIL